MKKNKFITLISLLTLLVGCNAEPKTINYQTMTLQDYKGVDFRNLVSGVIEERDNVDLSKVEFKNDRTPNENEVKVAVYIFHNDEFQQANYQYLIKGEDYRGSIDSTYRINSSLGDDDMWTGKKDDPVIIGLYKDQNFTEVIEESALENVDESLDEIYIRKVDCRYVNNYVYNGTYRYNDLIINCNENICEFTYNDNEYKLIGELKEDELNFHLEEIYVNDEKQDVNDYTLNMQLETIVFTRPVLCFYLFGYNGQRIFDEAVYAIRDNTYTVFTEL